MSTYAGNQGVRAVKVKANVTCTTKVEKITIHVFIAKNGALGGEVANDTQSTNKGEASLKNEKTTAECVSNARTTYYGIATATAIEGGKFYSTKGPVFSPNMPTYNCGTATEDNG